jgi:phosphatidylglycerol---prolipoprotein diacylglyceryl transferase
MLDYLSYPTWITPEIIPGLPIRWYGLMYVVAFVVTYLLIIYQVKRLPRPKISKRSKKGRLQQRVLTADDVLNLMLWSIIGMLLGARLVAATIYDPTHYYITHPWMIFWPFRGGTFVGLQGMSYHGGVIGAVLGGALYARRERRNFFELADLAIAAVPLGYTFGRLGNFFNAELWGRVSTAPWAMVFPNARSYPTTLSWVTDIADRIGMPYEPGAMLNLPRHPSQLYEAFFEGIVLWAILWFIFRKRRTFHGQLLGIYLIGYGVFRFAIEYLREPDADLGFVLRLGAESEPTALFLSLLNISMGQVLCLLMIAAGVLLMLITRRRYPIAAGPR